VVTSRPRCGSVLCSREGCEPCRTLVLTVINYGGPGLGRFYRHSARRDRMAQSAIASAVSRNRHVEVSDDIKVVFAKYDLDKSGDISSRELRTVLQDLKVATTRAQAKQMIAEVAGPEACKLNLEQFAVIVAVARTLEAPIIAEQPIEEICKHSMFGANKPLPHQGKMRAFYTNSWTKGIVAALIVANFGINIVEKEIDADVRSQRYANFWNGSDLFFIIAFLIELLFNMYGYGGPVRAFWRDGWNVFDFIIVVVGIALMSGDPPPPLNKLKLLRAFRIFRLFKRVESLNKIITALIGAIPGVMNAFVILFVVFCVYAILAVELFRDFGKGGTHPVMYAGANLNEVVFSFNVTSVTPRGYAYGFEYFGSFTRAMFTLFQVMRGDSWAEAVARPLVFGLYSNSISTSIYFASFVLLTSIVLINLVVVVLLDKFAESKEDDGGNDAEDVLEGVHEMRAPRSASGAELDGRRSPSGAELVGRHQSPKSRRPSAGLPTSTSTDSEMLAFIVEQLASLKELRTAEVSEEVKALRLVVDKCSDDVAKLKAGSFASGHASYLTDQAKADKISELTGELTTARSQMETFAQAAAKPKPSFFSKIMPLFFGGGGSRSFGKMEDEVEMRKE